MTFMTATTTRTAPEAQAVLAKIWRYVNNNLPATAMTTLIAINKRVGLGVDTRIETVGYLIEVESTIEIPPNVTQAQ